jgi:glycerophosphoryl diester phosphodiesterase
MKPAPDFISNILGAASQTKYFVLFLIAFVAVACGSRMYANTKINFDRQGHRGARGLMPENTIPAMLKAVDEGVTTLEMDVVITMDSQVVLSHEPFMNAEIALKPDGSSIASADARTHNIYKMNYEEVAKYDVGSKPHPRFPQQQKAKVHKPLLTDVIAAVEAYTVKNKLPQVQYNIETKCNQATDNIFHPEPPRFVDLLVAVVKQNKIAGKTTIQSFDIRSLQYLHAAYPQIQSALLIEEDDSTTFEKQLVALGFQPTVYSPFYSHVTPQLVKDCRSKKIKLIPWTVNDLQKMQALKNLGVDGIISDYPNLFKELK